MGKASYRPKRNQGRSEARRQNSKKNQEFEAVDELVMDKPIEDENFYEGNEQITKIGVTPNNRRNQTKLDSVKIIGDLECDYHVYIEDYVYTYIYQLAAADFTKESSAALIGEIFSDSKEVIVRGIIPVDMDKLQEDTEWIDMGVIAEIEDSRKNYFPDQDIIGWLHMQPGYGTMLTMKELREHQNVFEGNGTICMLVDAINKIETLFVYEEDELKEQSGYCMYYERNEEMQKFMLDNPFTSSAKEEMKDTVVNQFREIGKIRKAEYNQRRNLNFTVMAASVVLIALTAIIVKMNDQKNQMPQSENLAVLSNNVAVEQQQSALLLETEQVSSEAVGIEGEENRMVAEGSELTIANAQDVEAVMPEDVLENQETASTESQEGAGEQTIQDNIEYDIYVVEAGDTLADICYKEYGSAERSIEVARFNGLSDTNALFVGQELKMPK